MTDSYLPGQHAMIAGRQLRKRKLEESPEIASKKSVSFKSIHEDASVRKFGICRKLALVEIRWKGSR